MNKLKARKEVAIDLKNKYLKKYKREIYRTGINFAVGQEMKYSKADCGFETLGYLNEEDDLENYLFAPWRRSD